MDNYGLRDEDYQRFTATGRPMGSAPPVSAGFAGAGIAGVGGIWLPPSHLPMRFTDNSIITVPVRLADLQDPNEDFDAWWDTANKESKSRRRSIKSIARSILLREPAGSKRGDFVLLKITRGDYLKYCAKDENGKYIGTEPQSAGRAFLKDMVARQQTERSNSTATFPASTDKSPITYDVYGSKASARRPTVG